MAEKDLFGAAHNLFSCSSQHVSCFVVVALFMLLVLVVRMAAQTHISFLVFYSCNSKQAMSPRRLVTDKLEPSEGDRHFSVSESVAVLVGLLMFPNDTKNRWSTIYNLFSYPLRFRKGSVAVSDRFRTLDYPRTEEDVVAISRRLHPTLFGEGAKVHDAILVGNELFDPKYSGRWQAIKEIFETAFSDDKWTVEAIEDEWNELKEKEKEKKKEEKDSKKRKLTKDSKKHKLTNHDVSDMATAVGLAFKKAADKNTKDHTKE